MCVDPSVMKRMRALGGEEFLRQIVTSFSQNAEERIAAARAACARCDWEEVAARVHVLRSGALAVGATRVFDLAGEIEERSEKEAGAGVGELLARLQRSYESTMASLRRELRTPSDGE